MEIIWLILLAIITVGVFVCVVLGSFNVCTEGTDEIYQKTIAALDAIVELSVKLSTTLFTRSSWTAFACWRDVNGAGVRLLTRRGIDWTSRYRPLPRGCPRFC
jgi:hypothetical protein